MRAFHAEDEGGAPATESFVLQARQILEEHYPAILMDSLYFVRAYNNYNSLLFEPPQLDPGPMHVLLRLGQLSRLTEDGNPHPLVREFWFNTANLCGTRPYKDLLARLRGLSSFEEAWLSLAWKREIQTQPVNGPTVAYGPETGTFRVYHSRVDLPPTYYLRACVPADDLAQERLELFREIFPRPYIIFDEKVHWSQPDALTSSVAS
jgi:hypothetical protein